MNRQDKIQWRDNISNSLDKSSAVFLAHYKGMTVAELTGLRRELRSHNAEFHVVKNTIVKKAIEKRDENAFASLLKGQVGIVYAFGDAVAAAKVVKKTVKDCENLEILGGFMDCALMSTKSVDELASLPPREVLLAKIIGSLVSPHRGLLGVLSGVPRQFVQVLNAIKDKKSD